MQEGTMTPLHSHVCNSYCGFAAHAQDILSNI